MNNLPPGCSVSDLPGNRPEDRRFDRLVRRFESKGLGYDEDCFDHDLFVFELKNGRYEFLYGFSVEEGFLVRCYPGKELVEFVNAEAGLEFDVRPVD